jgi:hypothetical protein
MLHDQGDHARDHQQERQAADAVAATAMTVVEAVLVVMAVVMTVAVAMTTVSFAVALGFVEREFIAHPDIYFAHSVSFVCDRIWPLRRISSITHHISS